MNEYPWLSFEERNPPGIWGTVCALSPHAAASLAHDRSQPRVLRARAAERVGQATSSLALPALLPLLDDPDPVVQAGAVEGLGILPAPEATEAVRAVAADPARHPEVRREALDALGGWQR